MINLIKTLISAMQVYLAGAREEEAKYKYETGEGK